MVLVVVWFHPAVCRGGVVCPLRLFFIKSRSNHSSFFSISGVVVLTELLIGSYFSYSLLFIVSCIVS